MKITKQKLKYIIKEELDAMRGADRPGAGIEDIAEPDDEETRDRAFGSPEERLITLINARDVLNKMTPADLEALSLSLDAPMVATLRHILANPMYAPMQEGQGEDEELLNRLKQKYGRKADHFTVQDIQDLHPSYKGSLRDVAQGLGIR